MMTLEAARTVVERCAILGRYSEEPDRLTRRFGTPAMRQANEAVAAWMRAASMSVRQDNIGNVVGRYEGSSADARTLLLGSHLDTVRGAGQYDGPLGVLVALACVERLHALGERMPYAVEVIGFADEEGLRFHSAYLGSRALAGALGPEALDLTDEAGVTLAEAIRSFGGDPAKLADDARSRDDLLGYCEVHIEQGPVLEARGLPVGVVSAIQGQSRVAASFSGEAGHAGTVPMGLRRDALCAAAELVLATETLARARPGTVATVGQIAAQPGASNVIPGLATLSLDVRHPDDAAREAALRQLEERARGISEARQVKLVWRRVQDHPTVPCAPRLTHLLERAVEAEGYPVYSLPSGAGHDGVALAELTEIAMLFVRCRGGVSHHPDESVETEDLTVAIAALERFMALLADGVGGGR